MEENKSRFGNLKYNQFNILFKGLDFVIKLVDSEANFPNNENKKPIEQFKVIVKNKDKEINFYYYNSQMEREISEYLNSLKHLAYNNREFKTLMTKRFGWGGYDDVKNRRDLENKRIYHLFYVIVQEIGNNLNDEFNDFNFFCDNFGYDKDSRQAEKIFNACREQQNKIIFLNLTKQQQKYFKEEAGQETNKFSEDIKEAINKEQI